MKEDGTIRIDFRKYCPALRTRHRQFLRRSIGVCFDPEESAGNDTLCLLEMGHPSAWVRETSRPSGKYGEILVRCEGCSYQSKGFEVTLRKQKIKR